MADAGDEVRFRAADLVGYARLMERDERATA